MNQQVDITLPGGLAAALGLSGDAVAVRLTAIGRMAYDHWRGLAARTFKSTAADYINAVQRPVLLFDPAPTSEVHLLGAFANWLEWGKAWWDLRETVLRGPNVKHNKAGQRYMSIPFRHNLPGATGRQAPVIGQAYAAVGLDGFEVEGIRNAVSRAAKALRGNARLPEDKAGPLLRSWHNKPIYAGMQKVTKQYAKARRSQYMTFRTISEGSPNGWIHPGFKAKHLMYEVKDYIQNVAAPAVFRAEWRQF